MRMSTYAQLRELGLERPAMADLDAYQMPSKNLPGRAGDRRQTGRLIAWRRGSVQLPPALGAVRGLRVERVLGPRVLRVAPA